MRVLMVTGEYPPAGGGISDYTYLLNKALEQERVTTVTLSGDDTGADIRVSGWSWNLARRVRRAASEHGCDLVHIQYQAGAFDMHPAANLLPAMLGDLPVVTTFHDLRVPYLFPKAGRVRYAAMKRMARSSDAVIVSNPVDANILVRASIPVHEIRLGPSLPLPDRQVDPERSIGFFGYPSTQKGFDLLINALGRVPEAERPRLVIIGRQPPTHGSHGFHSVETVRQMTASRSIHVEWTGYLEPQEAINRMASTGAVAFPFPAGATLRSSALIAALRCGRPVITVRPNPPGHLDVLEHMPNLLTVDATDPDLLVLAITQALERPSIREDLPDPFQWSTIARKHRALYADLVGT